MNRNLYLFSVIFIFAANCLFAEDPPAMGVTHGNNGMMRDLRRRALTIDIDARVLDHEQVVIWSETHNKLAIPGSPVGIKMVGSNVVVAVQFTPFIRRHGQNVLVAQGQIWISDPEKGMSYYTSIQTIPLEFGKPISFFPLGSSSDTSIEMIITVNSNSASGASPADVEISAESAEDDK